MRTFHIPALLLFCAALHISAQPTITNADRPQAGDECPYLYSNDPFYFAIGPDVVWDLTWCIFTPTGTQYYVEGNTAPGSSHFPFDDLALTNADQTFYEFYNMTPTKWNVVGLYQPADDIWVTVTDPMEVMHYPCTYGTQWTEPYSYVWSDDPTVYTDTMDMHAAAYGTLLLPGGIMLTDVLGVLQASDGVDTAGGTVYSWIDQTLYLYKPGTRCMIGRLNLNMSFADGLPEYTFFSARVLNDASIGLDEVADARALELWPVPANGTLNVRWPGTQGAMDATVVDAMGRVVREQRIAVPADQATIDVSGLPAGTYLLRVVYSSGQATTRAFQVE